MTLTRAPVEAESSVTELPLFATQMWAPPVVMAHGSSNPHPRTFTLESGLTGVVDGKARETLSHAPPAADASTNGARAKPDRDSAQTTTVRLKTPRFALIDGPLRWTKVHNIAPIPCNGAFALTSQPAP